MHTFLNWFIPIVIFLLFELPSWWLDKRLKQKIPMKAARFFLVRLGTVIVLTLLLTIGIDVFLHASANPLGIFVALSLVYFVMYFAIMYGGFWSR